jgi:hypothetical protein
VVTGSTVHVPLDTVKPVYKGHWRQHENVLFVPSFWQPYLYLQTVLSAHDTFMEWAQCLQIGKPNNFQEWKQMVINKFANISQQYL